MNHANLTYLIIEDHLMLASLIEKQINAYEGEGKVIQAKTANEALQFFKKNYVDFVLLDLLLPDMDGITLIPKFKEINCDVKIIVITAETHISTIKKVLKLKIDAYVSKMNKENELINAVNAVKEGKRFISDNILDLLFNDDVKSETPVEIKEQDFLTKREFEILGYIADEMTTKQIADLLLISRHTVETHKRRMMQKMKVTNTAGLIKVAYEKELLKV